MMHGSIRCLAPLMKGALSAALGMLLAVLCAGVLADEAKEEAQFTGVIGKRLSVYAHADETSGVLGTVETGTVVDVYEKMRTYTRIDYNGATGYVLTKYIERVQRKNPLDGPMPGTTLLYGMGTLTRDVSFKPEGYKYAITLTAGSCLAVQKVSGTKAYFSYRVEPELQTVPLDALEMVEFTPWADAQPGDLICAFSTFYSSSQNSWTNVNRLKNIDLACERLDGVTIRAGGTFSFNEICAPYSEENGYFEAPILSGVSDTGYGGGVCQVATTVYNNVLRTPMWIVDHHWHGQGGTNYISGGYDATVSDKWNLVFENWLPYDLRLMMKAQDGMMTAAFYRADE